MSVKENCVNAFLDFIKKNPAYAICSLVYCSLTVLMLGLRWWSFLAVGAVYVIAMLVTFSSVGEWLMRKLNKVRQLETAEEKNYLRPLFQEVYDKAKTANPRLGTIDLCATDEMTTNACALGNRTIAVSRGAMSTFSEDELKAVLSHEIAHIINRDTAATLYALVGNGIFMILVLPLKLAFAELSTYENRGMAFFGLFFHAIIIGFLSLMQITINVNSRKAEQRADMFAVELGYGEHMVSALYLLDKMELGGGRSITQRLFATHPRTTERIKRLEVVLGIQNGQ